MKKTTLLVAFITLIGMASASQHTEGDVGTAIVASSANYPDAFVGASASQKIGAPVLLTDKDNLTDSTRNALENMGVDEVIILGGPEVISENVESEIDNLTNSTTRLWGVSQTGTSVEVSQYFWTESEQATIVQYPPNSDEGYKLLSAVKNKVQDEDQPVLISKSGTLSSSVLSEIDRLNVTEVEVYSTEATNVTEDLNELGAEAEINEGELNELAEEVEDREYTGNSSNLVVVAASNFRESLSAPTSANGASVTVSSEGEIQTAVERANHSSIEEVKVVGNPELANQVAEAIRNATSKEVEVVSGGPEQTAADQALKQRKNWSEIQEKRLQGWKEKVRNSKGLQKAANKTLARAESSIDENSSETARGLLQRAQEAYSEGDYFGAKKDATSALSESRVGRYKDLDREEIGQQYRDELEDFKSSVKDLREENRERAEELRQAKTQEERLEIVREYKEERREMRKELREQKRESREELANREDQEERRDSEEKRDSEQEREREDEELEVGQSEIEIESEDSTISSSVKYRAKNAGYSIENKSNAEQDQVNFSFEISSSDRIAAQQLTNLESEASETDLKPGNYSVVAEVSVDGDTINTVEERVEIEK